MPADRKIGLFGGTFDPIHSAHVTVAREAAEKFGLDEVLLVPAAVPPHKRGAAAAPYEDRYRMVELACRGDPRLKPSRLEEGRVPSYTIDTVRELKRRLGPKDRLYLIIGADAFGEITTWRRWEDLVREVEFIVATRPGHDYREVPGARVHRLDTLALPVSSSGIRARLAAGETPAELPEAVLEYIRKKGLYRKTAGR